MPVLALRTEHEHPLPGKEIDRRLLLPVARHDQLRGTRTGQAGWRARILKQIRSRCLVI